MTFKEKSFHLLKANEKLESDLIQFVETKQMLQTEPIEIGRLESLRIPSLAA